MPWQAVILYWKKDKMNPLFFKRVILGCLCVFLVSCQQEDEQAVLLDVNPSASLKGTMWKLQYIQSNGGKLQIPPDEFKESLSIYFESDSTFNAGSPCNAGFGRYVADGKGDIKVNSLGSTYKLCADKNRDWENKFFEGLRGVEKYVIHGEKLKVLGKNVLVFYQSTPL